jgi:ABC-type bacteriocin/lantibiotic exporter with double-glycine peptidase domain
MKLRYGSTPVTETIGVVVGVILLWVGGMQVIDKVMNPEDFIRFILIMFSVLTPIRRLNTVNQDL